MELNESEFEHVNRTRNPNEFTKLLQIKTPYVSNSSSIFNTWLTSHDFYTRNQFKGNNFIRHSKSNQLSVSNS